MDKSMKKAIIMGATSGIGLEVALLLAEKGWKVGVAGRRQQMLDDLTSLSENISTSRQIDVTQDDAPHILLDMIKEMGGIDMYFHSSGIGWQNTKLDIEKELLTVSTNAMGVTRMVDTMFNYFAEHPDKEGHIAVISSIASTKGLGAAPSYSATKRFVNHYLECLTQLCTIRRISNIKIHDIRPGFVRTPLISGATYPMQLDVKPVAKDIIRGIERGKSIITVDWRYRILVALWRLIPRWIWVRMRIH